MGEAPDIVLPPFTPSVWETDRDMVNLRKHINGQIRAAWNEGIESFIKGEWSNAAEKFQEVLTITNGSDGPSKLLLQEMKNYNWIPPPDWKGYRILS